MTKNKIKKRFILFGSVVITVAVLFIYRAMHTYYCGRVPDKWEQELKTQVVLEYQNADNIYLVRIISRRLGMHNGFVKPYLQTCTYEVVYGIKGKALNLGDQVEMTFAVDPVLNEHFIRLWSRSDQGAANDAAEFLFCMNRELEIFNKKNGIKTFQLGLRDRERMIPFDSDWGRILLNYLDEIGWLKQISPYLNSENFE